VVVNYVSCIANTFITCFYLTVPSYSERVYMVHRAFTVIDPKFREMLQNDIRGVFLKRYKAFFDKYSRIQFSKKNMETYLKYSPQKIDSLISQLFAQV
jgi:exocyst complex protein 7